MKKTTFYNFHETAGAKLVPFAGFMMPVEYSGIRDEHKTVREKVGVFDVSHMGEIWVKGTNAFQFVQWVTTNDVSQLFDGKVQYSCFPNFDGGIIDDVLVYQINRETYLLVVNASNIQKDWDWLSERAKEKGLAIGQELYNASDEISQLAVQGPLALQAMQKLTDSDVMGMEYYTFKKIDFAGIKNLIFSTTGYTGAGGCEIYVANEDAPKLWKAVFEAGEEFGIKPIGLGARDTLRLEMGFALYGNDIDDTTSPIEAGLGWITKFNSANNFIGKELFEKQKNEGVNKRLKGIKMIERGIPRHEYLVFNSYNEQIGVVTSGTISPMSGEGIGMAYINEGYWAEGCEIFIEIRNKMIKASISSPPFYKK